MDQARIVKFLCLLAVPVSLGLIGPPLDAQIHRVSDPVRRADLHAKAELDRMIMVPMRDGVRLATEIYRPRGVEGPVPTIFWRTPYNFSPLPGPNLERPSALLKFGLDAIERGYAFVVQNERGKFFSEGDWEILGRPRTDGYDALSWITGQSWSNGKVATLGCSSTAEWQMGLAAMRHPGHAAAVPMGQGAGIGRMGPFYEQGNFYRGGALQLPMAVWLYGEQNTLRPTFPPGASREDLARLATYFDLAAKMPAVDWQQALRHLPVQEPDGIRRWASGDLRGVRGPHCRTTRPGTRAASTTTTSPSPCRPCGQTPGTTSPCRRTWPSTATCAGTPTRRSGTTSTWS